MDKVRYGVIGIGNMGAGHAADLFKGATQNAVLTAVCDNRQSRLDWAEQTFGDKVARFSDYKEMYDSGLIDAVIIATPHYLHPTMAIDAFAKGIHALSEKPIGVYTKAVKEMYAAAAKAAEKGIAFGIDYNQRTNPYYQKMREIVRSGELGDLKRCVWIITDWYRTQAYYDSGTWRATWAGEGGGVLMNQAPHNLDLWQWITGMPCAVTGECEFGKYHNIEVEDDVTIYAKYPNGGTAVFITTTGECPGTNRLEISGTKGKIVLEGSTLKWTKLSIDERDYCFHSEDGFKKCEWSTEDITFPNGGTQHNGIRQNFTNHILCGEELLAPGTDGINGLSICNAALLSSWKGGKEIALPLDDEEYWAELQKHIAVSKSKENIVEKTASLDGTYGVAQ